MISTILIVIAVIIVAVVGFAAMQPNDFCVSRSATMSATPAKVFAQVNDFHNWEGWSPWAKLDPNSKSVFEGPASGVGAVFRWAGNKDVLDEYTLADLTTNRSRLQRMLNVS